MLLLIISPTVAKTCANTYRPTFAWYCSSFENADPGLDDGTAVKIPKNFMIRLCRRYGRWRKSWLEKEISVKKYVGRLSAEERQQLETLIRKGKSAARRLLKARILLKADVSEAGPGWSDSKIIVALDTRVHGLPRAQATGGRRGWTCPGLVDS
jgi:hypothetical protein